AGALVSPWAAASAPLMLVVAGLCAFAGVFGPAAAGGGVTVAVLFAVSLASPPHSTLAALERGAAVAGSGAWAMTLALLFWPVRVYKPARYAVARVDRALAAHARAMARHVDVAGSDQWIAEVTRRHGAIRTTIEQARDVLAATRRGRPGESGRGERLLVCLQLADQLFGALVALEEVLDNSPARAAAARALGGVAASLDTLADRVEPEGRLPPAPPIAWSGDEARAAGDAHAALLIGRVRAYVELAFETVATLHEERPPAGTPAATLAARAETPSLWERVRENLTTDSVLARHALRVGVTAALAVVVTRAIGLQRGYWVTLTVVILLQPHRPATFTKALQRVAGTVGGAIVAALLLSSLHDARALLVIATILAGVSAAVVQLNYALFAFFLTPTFVLLAELNGRDWHLAEVRIVNTLLGGVLALAASRLLWPHRERDRFADEMARVLDALADYVATAARVIVDAVPAPAPTLPPVRRRLGLLLNGAEASFERLLAERSAPRAAHEPAMTLLLYVRRIGATLGAAVSVRSVTPLELDRAALEALAAAATAALRALAGAVQRGEAPPPLPPFDALLAPFEGTLLGARLARLAQQLTVLSEAVARGKIGAARS
ncbi:MAG: FUSC family protein, partial [Polyangia bacterium]